MGAQVVDYRVSTLVVLCKDCGHDVGLYPARHKCQPMERPAMPVLSAQYYNETKLNPSGYLELSARTNSSESSSSMASSTSPSFSSAEPPSSKWSSRHQSSKPDDENEDSVYFNNIAANLSEKNETSGKKLWGKIRQNEKWKQLSEQNDKPKQSGKLWGKLIQATQNMADKIPLRDDRGPADSDEDDWEGETHISRILREHYEKKRLCLPEWLFDEKLAVSRRGTSDRRSNDKVVPVQQQHKQQPDGPMRAPSRRRLWEQNPDAKNMSSRERERQELRQAQPPMPPLNSENRSRYNRDHYDNRDISGGRYNNNGDNFEDDRYSHRSQQQDRDYERHSQPRNDDRYSNEKYKSNHHDNYNGYSQGRDRYDAPLTPQTSSRDQPRNFDDDRYAQKPLYPLSRSEDQQQHQQHQQQRYKSTNRPRYQEEDRSGYHDSSYVPHQSERSKKGYNQSEPRSNHYYQHSALDDYNRGVPSQSRDRVASGDRYHSPPEMSRREPSIRSGGRRYGNDSSYF
ncbi:hypothetical protein [Parasitella parasitica]|uniref:Mso1 N-terminal domain-containing protein n=1 Tax=Parasitella parasitica TaxID=35722 RepID=A0A0B7N6W3_9FUNG|nr:hypothetical protein [Parasitella parasitica]